jgi:hypothetical protein
MRFFGRIDAVDRDMATANQFGDTSCATCLLISAEN